MGCYGDPKFPISWVCYQERCLSMKSCAELKSNVYITSNSVIDG